MSHPTPTSTPPQRVRSHTTTPWKWISLVLIVVSAIVATLLVVTSLTRPGSPTTPNSQSSFPGSGSSPCVGSICSSTPGGSAPTCQGDACTSKTDGMTPPVVGIVRAVSDTSITIDADGRRQTFTISGDTTEFNDNSATPKKFDKHNSPVGEMVGIVPTSPGGSEAKTILSNYQAM